MIIKMVLSTGKEIEVTQEELKEILSIKLDSEKVIQSPSPYPTTPGTVGYPWS